jgi:sec-independent protein translocase protein TatC
MATLRMIPRWLRRRDHDPSRSMTMVEHLEELRRRVFISVIAVVLAAIIGWFLSEPTLHLILKPYVAACRSLPPAQHPPTRCNQLILPGVVGPFLVRLKLALYVGLGIALPIVLFQLWRFITPGLTQKERKLTVPFILSSLVLFGLGAFFAYWTLPKGLHFLLGFGGSNLVVLPEATKYISFVLLLTLAFGISFEFPLVLIFLAWIGLVSSARLRQWRRYAILFIVIFAAVITPSQDPFTLCAMSIPMIVFYEATIWITRLMKR